MKILFEVEVDESTGVAYERLSAENKKQFYEDVTAMLQNTTGNAKSEKIKKMLEEIWNCPAPCELNPDILYELLRGAEEDVS